MLTSTASWPLHPPTTLLHFPSTFVYFSLFCSYHYSPALSFTVTDAAASAISGCRDGHRQHILPYPPHTAQQRHKTDKQKARDRQTKRTPDWAMLYHLGPERMPRDFTACKDAGLLPTMMRMHSRCNDVCMARIIATLHALAAALSFPAKQRA